MSSPPLMSCVGSTESLGSDVESLVSIGTNDDVSVYHIPEDTHGNKFFELGDGDFNICVNGTAFHTHKYLLKRFGVLKRLIEQRPAGDGEDLPLEHDPTDFANAFKVLYESFIEATPEFDATTLVSTLRVATAYDYPALRTFAIEKLEGARLSAIERIRIAREFSLTSWEPPAYEELCTRDEPILEAEANVLGISAFVQVARIREQHQQRKREATAYQENEGIEPQTINGVGKASSGESATQIAVGMRDFQGCKLNTEVESVTKGISLEGAETGIQNEEFAASVGKAVPDFKPCFIDKSLQQPRHIVSAFSKTAGSLRYKIPGCQCRRKVQDIFGEIIYSQCHCEIPPCVGDAFEELQASQIAHSTSISRLESAIQDIMDSFPVRKPTMTANSTVELLNEPQATFVQTEIRKWFTTRA